MADEQNEPKPVLFNPMELYGHIQNMLDQGILIVECQADNYTDFEGKTKVIVRLVWFPTGVMNHGEPVADISFPIGKELHPKTNYSYIGFQIAHGMLKYMAEKFSGIINKSPDDLALEYPEFQDRLAEEPNPQQQPPKDNPE